MVAGHLLWYALQRCMLQLVERTVRWRKHIALWALQCAHASTPEAWTGTVRTCSAHLVFTSPMSEGVGPSVHAQVCHIRQMRLRCNNCAHHTASFSGINRRMCTHCIGNVCQGTLEAAYVLVKLVGLLESCTPFPSGMPCWSPVLPRLSCASACKPQGPTCAASSTPAMRAPIGRVCSS